MRIHKRVKDELRCRKMLVIQFRKQKKYLLDNIKYLWDRQNMCLSALYLLEQQPNKIDMPYNTLIKTLDYKKKKILYDGEEWLAGYRTEMELYNTTNKLTLVARKAAERGYTSSYNKNGKKLTALGIVKNPRLIDKYIDLLEDVQLSDYRGSINRTTKLAVLGAIRDGVQQNMTYNEVANNITNISEELFSQARAKLIAVTEIGRAYGYGNYLPMRQAQDMGQRVIKSWLTVGDDRVRPEHTQNEEDGRIEFDDIFSGTLELVAPSVDFNCRCDTLYEFK